MKPFKRNGGPGKPPGGRKFGGKTFKKGGYGDRDRGFERSGSPEMHPAVCAKCGKTTEVPFKPNGRRPIFCRECFQQEDRPEREERVRGAFGRPKFSDRRTFDAAPRVDDQIGKRLEEMNAKLDRVIRALEEIKEQNG